MGENEQLNIMNNYFQYGINRFLNPELDSNINNTRTTIKAELVESTNILNREYTLLFIWFIIALIMVILTVVSILSNQLNGYVLYLSLGFLIFITFYIFKNIYIYFNG